MRDFVVTSSLTTLVATVVIGLVGLKGEARIRSGEESFQLEAPSVAHQKVSTIYTPLSGSRSLKGFDRPLSAVYTPSSARSFDKPLSAVYTPSSARSFDKPLSAVYTPSSARSFDRPLSAVYTPSSARSAAKPRSNRHKSSARSAKARKAAALAAVQRLKRRSPPSTDTQEDNGEECACAGNTKQQQSGEQQSLGLTGDLLNLGKITGQVKQQQNDDVTKEKTLFELPAEKESSLRSVGIKLGELKGDLLGGLVGGAKGLLNPVLPAAVGEMKPTVNSAAVDVEPAVKDLKPLASDIDLGVDNLKPVANALRPLAGDVEPAVKDAADPLISNVEIAQSPQIAEVKPIVKELAPPAAAVKVQVEDSPVANVDLDPLAKVVSPVVKDLKPEIEDVGGELTKDLKQPIVKEVKPVGEELLSTKVDLEPVTAEAVDLKANIKDVKAPITASADVEVDEVKASAKDVKVEVDDVLPSNPKVGVESALEGVKDVKLVKPISSKPIIKDLKAPVAADLLIPSNYKRPVPNSSPLYESPKVTELPEKCQGRLYEVKKIIEEMLNLTEKFSQRILLDSKISYMTREILSKRLERIRSHGEEARMAAHLANLKALSESIRAAGLELLRVANNPVTQRLEPAWRPFTRELRSSYLVFRKACKSQYTTY